MRWLPLSVALLVLAPLPAVAAESPWQLTPTNTEARFRGLSAVSDQVAWAGGSGGVVLRTVDGGRAWQRVDPPGATTLQFRDIHAFDDQRAVVLSIGEGADSRVYRTSDGGRSWQLAFQNAEPKAFYDCLTFFDSRNGIALSDPVGGKFRILSTSDSGRSWTVLPDKGMPPALAKEAAFAASGQCLVSSGRRDAWFATGGGERSRVFHTADRGRTWQVSESPVAASESAGIFGMAFTGKRHGIAVGGDFANATGASTVALTSDGGRTWQTGPNQLGGYRSGIAVRTSSVLAVGPTGSDVSRDGGRTWTRLDEGSFDTVDCTPDGACWASGERGRIAKLRYRVP
ncbi:YCF48-related protein [Allokutzneria sp. A3M-2-11 16]|uniref:WD40/YVTN/BNR-like repeat-containing protein n=1 Tax=Allokutzneria sp. A3M-2-11 16 TaxID=2962043 RepID=UPI0020B75938|nr:YCF48-related protein [Allokutzneria sp. A3M-2-11 16]MCP3800774.1 YCF48-related protein [Allokutzneria sp. A3M-2-11 16]